MLEELAGKIIEEGIETIWDRLFTKVIETLSAMDTPNLSPYQIISCIQSMPEYDKLNL